MITYSFIGMYLLYKCTPCVYFFIYVSNVSYFLGVNVAIVPQWQHQKNVCVVLKCPQSTPRCYQNVNERTSHIRCDCLIKNRHLYHLQQLGHPTKYSKPLMTPDKKQSGSVAKIHKLYTICFWNHSVSPISLLYIHMYLLYKCTLCVYFSTTGTPPQNTASPKWPPTKNKVDQWPKY
jgi:hypothetical protein